MLRWDTVFVLVAGFMAMAAPVLVAEDDVLARADINASLPEFMVILQDMQEAASNAESVLGDVKSMDIKAARSATESLFNKLRKKVNEVLEGLAPNSVLMDNLEGAKANAIVLKRWFERQPSDYPDRDHQIMRLEEGIQGYGELTDQIMAGRQEAQDVLRELLRARFIRSMELMVGSVEHSVDVTKRLVSSLQALSAKIRQMAEQELPEQSIAN